MGLPNRPVVTQGYLNPPVVFDRIIGIAFTAAFIWVVLGTLFKTFVWMRSRSSLTIVLAPAPTSYLGVAGRLLLELFTFRSLWRASPLTWIASLAMHYGFLLILLMHLRFVFKNLPLWLVPLIQYSGWAALCMLGGLSILFMRRVLVDRIRYVSSPSDYLHLLLLFFLALSGVLLKRIWPTDLYAAGEFLRGALSFSWQPLPDHTGLLVHVLLVLLLLLIFPVSKLVHGIGILFAPTFVQRDAAGKPP